MAIRGEDDVHVTEEVFKRPLFLQPSYRYWPGLRGGPSVLSVGARWACSPGAASVSPSAGWAESAMPVSPLGMVDVRGVGCVAYLMGCSLLPGRYHRLPLPEQGAPLEAQFDAFVSVLRVSGDWKSGGSLVGCAGAWRGGLCQGPVSLEMLGWPCLQEEGRGGSVCLCECAALCCLTAEPSTECLEDWVLWLWLGSSLCCVILDDS